MPPVAASNGLPSSSRLPATYSRPSAVSSYALLALGLDGLDQALVLELLERGVDRAGARLPDALGAALDLLDELVAVLRLLLEEQEHGGADVAAPGAAAATATAVPPGPDGPPGPPGPGPQNIALNWRGSPHGPPRPPVMNAIQSSRPRGPRW